jgi:quinol---cytochrome-c reductase cytochrome b subunit
MRARLGRLRAASLAGRLYRRGRADRWSAMFGQIAVYSFVMTAISGVFLLFYFKPGMTAVTYHGSYRKLDGVPMSEAYRSTLDLSFDMRGGLLMRQIHHWAALLFVAAVCGYLLRLYFTGAFRRRRWLDWAVWVTMLALGMVAGLSGTILPDDSMSGGSLDVLQGVTLSVPVIGSHLALWIFGGDFPGHEIIGRAYWVHVAVLPAVMVALLVLLRWRGWRGSGRWRGWRALGRPRRRGGRRHDRGQRGARGWPLVTPAPMVMFLFTCAALVLLGTFAQINPVWLVGPYQPGSISAGAVPGWYMGFVDGALRIMPGWEISVAGHPLTLAVLVPGVLMPGAFFTLLAAYPLLDRKLTADPLIERPREAATRTAVGAAGITFYGMLWAAAANDEIAYHLRVPLYAVSWFFRIAVLVGPVLAFGVTQRLCLGLARRDQYEAEHGRETGRIVMSPDGGYHEIREAVRRPVAAVASAAAVGPGAAGARDAAAGPGTAATGSGAGRRTR